MHPALCIEGNPNVRRVCAQAEPLLVTTMLTTGDAKGQRLGGTGELMDSNGYCK